MTAVFSLQRRLPTVDCSKEQSLQFKSNSCAIFVRFTEGMFLSSLTLCRSDCEAMNHKLMNPSKINYVLNHFKLNHFLTNLIWVLKAYFDFFKFTRRSDYDFPGVLF
jgi:hypothetical protein